MAKPIRATPTLSGQEALDFVDAMRRRESNPSLTKVDKDLLKIIEENRKLFRV